MHRDMAVNCKCDADVEKPNDIIKCFRQDSFRREREDCPFERLHQDTIWTAFLVIYILKKLMSARKSTEEE